MVGVLCLGGCSASSDQSATTTEAPAGTEVADVPAPDEPTPDGPDGASAAPEPESQASGEALHLDPTQATGAVVGVPSPTNTAPIVAVANYFTDLPGFDLSLLSNSQKEKFLHRVNSEMCTCGCKNDTLARCTVNDPNCPVVRGMVQRVFDEVRSQN
jgi:hypothetical protein